MLMSISFSAFYEKYKKLIYSIGLIIVAGGILTISTKYLKYKYNLYQSDKNQLIQIIKSQTDEIKQEHNDAMAKLQEIGNLKTQVSVIAKQNQDIKNKLQKYEQNHPVQNVSSNEDTKTIVDNINSWYDNKTQEKTKIVDNKIILGEFQLKDFYFDAANWHFNAPILKTELDYSKELNKSYEEKSQKDDTIIDKQSKLIDNQQKTLDLQENRFQNSVKLNENNQKQINNLSKQVKVEKIEKYGAFLVLMLKLLIK